MLASFWAFENCTQGILVVFCKTLRCMAVTLWMRMHCCAGQAHAQWHSPTNMYCTLHSADRCMPPLTGSLEMRAPVMYHARHASPLLTDDDCEEQRWAHRTQIGWRGYLGHHAWLAAQPLVQEAQPHPVWMPLCTPSLSHLPSARMANKSEHTRMIENGRTSPWVDAGAHPSVGRCHLVIVGQTGCSTGRLQEAEPHLQGMTVRIPSLGCCLLVRLQPGSLLLLLARQVCQQTPQLHALALHLAVESLHAGEAVPRAGLGHLQAGMVQVAGVKQG